MTGRERLRRRLGDRAAGGCATSSRFTEPRCKILSEAESVSQQSPPQFAYSLGEGERTVALWGIASRSALKEREMDLREEGEKGDRER